MRLHDQRIISLKKIKLFHNQKYIFGFTNYQFYTMGDYYC